MSDTSPSSQQLHAFHLTDPPLSRFDHPSHLKDVLRDSPERRDGDVPIGVFQTPSATVEERRLSAASESTSENARSADARHHAPSPWSKRREREALEPITGPIPLEDLHDIAEESSHAERRADEAERGLMEWKKSKIHARSRRRRVRRPDYQRHKIRLLRRTHDLFIEGLVPLNSLNDDRYTYHENTREIIRLPQSQDLPHGTKNTSPGGSHEIR